MTAGQLFSSALLADQFIESRVAETARKLKEIWPDGLPEGRQPINQFDAAYFIYILCTTEGTKDVPLALERSMEYGVEQTNGSPVIALANIINSVPSNLDKIHLSIRTGFMDVYYTDKAPQYFPSLKKRREFKWVEESELLKSLRQTMDSLIKEIPNVSEPAQKILIEEVRLDAQRIKEFTSAREKWNKKFKVLTGDKVDLVTVLDSSFITEFSEETKK